MKYQPHRHTNTHTSKQTNNSSTHANAELLLVCRKKPAHCTVYTRLCGVLRIQRQQRRIPPQQTTTPTTITFHDHTNENGLTRAIIIICMYSKEKEEERTKHADKEKDKTN